MHSNFQTALVCTVKKPGHRTLLPIEAMVVESDVRGVAAVDVLLRRPYDLAEPPVTA